MQYQTANTFTNLFTRRNKIVPKNHLTTTSKMIVKKPKKTWPITHTASALVQNLQIPKKNFVFQNIQQHKG